MVICRLHPILVEIGQIGRLLPQRHLSHMVNARIRCFVFAVLWFALFNVPYFSIIMILKDVCLLPV
jgi:energy-coupling factor transporter transmembrane protein EcfT